MSRYMSRLQWVLPKYAPNLAGVADVCPESTKTPTCVPIPVDKYSNAGERHPDGVGVID